MDALIVQRLSTSNPELCKDQAYALAAVSLSFCGACLDQKVSSVVHVCPPDSQTDSPPRFEFVDAHRRKAMSLRSDGDCYSGIAVTGKITDKIVALTKRWLGQLLKEKGDL